MCETIKIARIAVFFVVFIMLFVSIYSGFRFCKKNNININEFSGLFEMYHRIFTFENKKFSILMLICMYLGAVLVFVTIGVSFWAEGQGCVFPTKYS